MALWLERRWAICWELALNPDDIIRTAHVRANLMIWSGLAANSQQIAQRRSADNAIAASPLVHGGGHPAAQCATVGENMVKNEYSNT